MTARTISMTQTRPGRWSAWEGPALRGWVATSDGGRSWHAYTYDDTRSEPVAKVGIAPSRDLATDKLIAALEPSARRLTPIASN